MLNSHIHLDFNNDVDCNGIVPSIGKQNWHKVAKYKNFALGIHPYFVENHNADDVSILENNIKKLNPIAIGEIGLDFAKNINKELQVNYFIKQLDLAKKYKLPVIVHAVKSYDEVCNILKQYNLKTQIHAFNGSVIQGQKLLSTNCYLSFGLYKKSIKLQQFIKDMPNDKILIETDEQKNNMLKFVIAEISKLKNTAEQEIIKICINNINSLFNLKKLN